MPTAQRFAPAKTNLYLEVLGRRDDGFHELETVFACLDWGDDLSISTNSGQGRTSVRVDGPLADGVPTDARNLAWQAADRWRTASGLSDLDIHLDLTKYLPHGGGLGGGSSDAAAVLLGLSECLPDAVSTDQLRQIAAGLGSDVAIFLYQGVCYATGRGERLTPLPDLETLPISVIDPGFSCATPAVFSALTDAERGPRPARGQQALTNALSGDFSKLIFNRLTAPAQRVAPQLTTLAASLDALDVPWWLSGSGACCLALGHLASSAGLAGCTITHTTFRQRSAG